jgi:hypothetical protein
MRSATKLSPGLMLAALIGLLALTACRSTPQGVQEMAQSMEPLAIAAAKERAQTDLNCAALKTNVLSRETGGISSEYDLHRVVYRIETSGCRLRTVYAVACTPKGVCSAISEGGTIERTQ